MFAVVAGGGTAGHVLPGLAVADALVARGHDRPSIHFVGARRGMEAGLSPLDAARQTDLGEFAGLTDPERIVGNLHRAYAELAGGERGVLIDMRGALGDMVIYNGGRPLTCHA